MKEIILSILLSIRPEAEFKQSVNFLEDGYLDSFDIIILVSELEKEFNILIPGEQVSPENFMNISTIVSLLDSLINK
ncbi:MAG: acyl carrier protein [Gammaproteobacteria bacterium]|jgi:acyl carrier protein|nr:acyl carrier protein [Gammaproteobacteria bacterium]